MKGVLICGGTGTRLHPLTKVTHKSLLPIYDQPLIHYPLHTLLGAGIRDILVITHPDAAGRFMEYLSSGEKWDCNFTYRLQEKPRGIAHALGMAEQFAEGDAICAVLGDNIYFDNIAPTIQAFTGGAHIFTKEVSDPHRFGVVEMQGDTPISIEEKPANPKSNHAQTGCYVYDARCFDVIRSMQPSPRGEYEITDVTRWYLQNGELGCTQLQDHWIDAGTFESLYHATTLVRERKQQIATAKTQNLVDAQ